MTYFGFKRSVASITSGLSRIVSDLEAHIEAKLAEREVHRQTLMDVNAKLHAADTEVGQARSISAKISALLS